MPSIFVRKFDRRGGSRLGTVSGHRRRQLHNNIKADGLGNLYVGGYTYGSTIGPNAGRPTAFWQNTSTDWRLALEPRIWHERLRFRFLPCGRFAGQRLYFRRPLCHGQRLEHANQDVFITKFDSSGNQQWTRQLSTTANDEGVSVWVGQFGQRLRQRLDVWGVGRPEPRRQDVFVVKYNSAGDLQWIQQFGTSGHDAVGPRWIVRETCIFRQHDRLLGRTERRRP